MNCVGLFFIQPFTFDIRILWLAVLYIGEEVLMTWWTGFAVSSALFHSLGAVLGFRVLGVHVENELGRLRGVGPVFGVVRGPTPASRRVVQRGLFGEESVDEAAIPEPDSKIIWQTQSSSGERRRWSRFAVFSPLAKPAQPWPSIRRPCIFARPGELTEQHLLQFIEFLCAYKHLSAAVPLLEEYLIRFEKRVGPVRLRLAKILIEQQQRPSYAARVLEQLPTTGMGAKEVKLRSALEAKAQKLLDDGVLELEGRAWVNRSGSVKLTTALKPTILKGNRLSRARRFAAA